MTKDPDLVDYYSRRAHEYERIYHKPERQMDLRSLRRLVAGRLADLDVLEIACGTGYWTEVIAPAARSVVATDASEAVIEVARHKTYPDGRVRFTTADAFDPDSVDGRFTALFAGFFWSHLPRTSWTGFLRGWGARLGPGQRMLLIDNRFVEGSSTPIAGRDADGNTFQVRRLDDGSEPKVIKNFPDEKELHRTIAPFSDEVEVAMLEYFWMLSATTGLSRKARGGL